MGMTHLETGAAGCVVGYLLAPNGSMTGDTHDKKRRDTSNDMGARHRSLDPQQPVPVSAPADAARPLFRRPARTLPMVTTAVARPASFSL